MLIRYSKTNWILRSFSMGYNTIIILLIAISNLLRRRHLEYGPFAFCISFCISYIRLSFEGTSRPYVPRAIHMPPALCNNETLVKPDIPRKWNLRKKKATGKVKSLLSELLCKSNMLLENTRKQRKEYVTVVRLLNNEKSRSTKPSIKYHSDNESVSEWAKDALGRLCTRIHCPNRFPFSFVFDRNRWTNKKETAYRPSYLPAQLSQLEIHISNSDTRLHGIRNFTL